MTLSEEVYMKIKEDVNTLAIRANEFLNEQQLAEQYGVSKAPIRSALHRLCQEGILVSYPRKGYVVKTLSEAEYLQAQNMRVLNESYALELLHSRASREQLLKLREVAASGQGVRDNTAFHLAIADAAGNRFLYETVEHLLCAVTRTMYTCFPGDQVTFRDSHIGIVDALLAGNLELAKKRLTEDIL